MGYKIVFVVVFCIQVSASASEISAQLTGATRCDIYCSVEEIASQRPSYANVRAVGAFSVSGIAYHRFEEDLKDGGRRVVLIRPSTILAIRSCANAFDAVVSIAKCSATVDICSRITTEQITGHPQSDYLTIMQILYSRQEGGPADTGTVQEVSKPAQIMLQGCKSPAFKAAEYHGNFDIAEFGIFCALAENTENRLVKWLVRRDLINSFEWIETKAELDAKDEEIQSLIQDSIRKNPLPPNIPKVDNKK